MSERNSLAVPDPAPARAPSFDHASGLEFDDLVQRAGYVESDQPLIRIIRSDAVVGKVTLTNDGSGEWLLSSIEGCGGTQFDWSEEATGVSGPM